MGNNSYSIINGIKFLWGFDNRVAIREVTKDNLNYNFKEFSQTILEDACKWINSKKEHFLNTYENPINMLTYLKKHNDISRHPHGYVISRILKNEVETNYFEDYAKKLLKEFNTHPTLYFTYGAEKGFRIKEADLNYFFGITDHEFFNEINKRINETRKKLKLVINEEYFK